MDLSSFLAKLGDIATPGGVQHRKLTFPRSSLSRRLLAALGPLLFCLGGVQAARAETQAAQTETQPAQAETSSAPATVADKTAFPGLSAESLGALSVGHPHEGFLFNGIRMPDGPYWTVALPQYAFGTEETIFALVHCITLVNQQFDDTPKVIIGSISKEHGGPFSPHKSHQSGRDVDVGFYYNPGYPVAKPATRENLDVERTWALVRAFITETDVDMILIDKSVQRLLEVHALRKGENPAWLKSLFHDVDGPYSSLIKHVPGHQAHMHVRFSSPLARQRGKSAYPQLVKQGHLPLAQRELQHQVQRGDTLIGIARTHKTDVKTIQRLNELTSTKIRVGQTLVIREPRHLRGAFDPIIVPKRRLPAAYREQEREARLNARDHTPASK